MVESGTHEPVRAYIEKEEFVERLTPLRKKALKSEQMPVSKRTYTYEEPLALSVAHEPVRPYGAKDEPTT